MTKDIEPILKVLDNPLLMPAPVDQDEDLLRHLYHPPPCQESDNPDILPHREW